MATISESIKLNDGVTPILKNMQQAMQNTIGAFERMQKLSESNMDMAELEAARANMLQVGAAIRMAEEEQARLNATMRKMEAPDINTPRIEPNVMPRAPTVDVPHVNLPTMQMPQVAIPQIVVPPIALNVQGYEASLSKIQTINGSMDRLVESQKSITRQAEMIDFIPDNTQSEILKLENGMNGLRSSLENITAHHKKLNGVMSKGENEKAVKGIKELETNILSAVALQDKLNKAMESGDLDGMNKSAKELESSIAKLEKQAMRLGKQYEGFNSNLLIPNIPQISLPPVQSPTIPPINTPPIGMPQIPSISIPELTMTKLDLQITGYESALEKVRFINTGLERLVTTQDKVNRQAQLVDIMPSATQNNIQKADNSIRALVKSLQMAQARQQDLNGTMSKAESNNALKSINRLENGIVKAIKSQDKLNSAMESGDLKNINRAANELTRNINRAERETNKLNRAQQEHNRSLDDGNSKANGILSTLKNMLGMYAGFSAAKGMFTGALELDKMERTFQARLGDKEAGSALFEKLKQQAEDSAFSLEELANNTASFLSMTTDPKQIDGLNSLAEKLAMFDTTGQGLAGAGFSIKEAMSGDIISLAERFNMSKSLIRALGIDDLGKEGDIEGFVAQFEKLLDIQNMGEDAYAELLKAPETQFRMLKSNFKTAFSDAAIASITALQPLIERLNAFMDSDGFKTFLNNMSMGLLKLANGAIWAWDGLTRLWVVLKEVYAVLEPYSGVIFAAVASLAAFKTGMLIVNGLIAINKIAVGLSAAAHWLYTTAVAVATTGQIGFNAALAACPVMWVVALIAILIGIIIAVALYIKKLWDTNDQFAAGFMRTWNSILNFFDVVQIGFIEAFNGILNFMGSFKVGFLSILEGAINGAIGMINSFIGLLNAIPGVSIDVIEKVSFAAESKAAEEAKKQSRAEDVEKRWSEYGDKTVKREQNVQNMLSDRASKRQAEEDAKANNDNKDKGNTYAWDNFAGKQLDMGDIDKVGEVGKIKDKVEISSEDLALMREMAEMTAIQNYVTLKPEIKVQTGDIRNDVDIDTVVKRIEQTIEVEVAAHAKEVYNLG